MFRVLRGWLRSLYVDAAYDCGAHLLVVTDGETDLIPYSNVSRIQASYMSPMHVKIIFKSRSKFGREIWLHPNVPFPEYSGFVKALRQRVVEEEIRRHL